MEQIDYDVDEFMDYCTSKNLATKTIGSYEQTLRLFTQYLKEKYKVKSAGDTKELRIREYIKYLHERGKYTVARIKEIKHSRKVVGFIDDINFNKLLKCFDLSKFHEYRDYIISLLIFDTGMRLGETLLIKESDIDFAKRTTLTHVKK